MITRLLAMSLLLVAACSKDSTSQKAKPEAMTSREEAAAPASATRVDISVTEKGFEPEDVAVPTGQPVTLVFTRKTDETCAKEVILTMADGTKIEKELPLDKPVEIAATFPTAGKLVYACGMDMMKGTVTVQ